MKRIKVNSSNILEIGYSIVDKILEVKFIKGTIYQYYEVLPKTFCNLIFAESIGSYFMKNIVRNFRHEKVEGE